MSEFDVVLERVSKTFPGGARAVIDFNAEFKHGEFIAMLGPWWGRCCITRTHSYG